MKKSLLCLIPCALCLAAQEEPIRITVYASRIEDDKADMPVAVQTFDAAEIAASGARFPGESIDEVFRKVMDEAKADPEHMHERPAATRVRRPDEVKAARKPVVRYDFGA